MKVGDKVVAVCTITEGGGNTTPNPNARKLNDPGWIHAWPGDEGEIMHIDSDNGPTVRFEPIGTATIVGAHEIKLKTE